MKRYFSCTSANMFVECVPVYFSKVSGPLPEDVPPAEIPDTNEVL